MGGGSWTSASFVDYSITKGMSCKLNDRGIATMDFVGNAQDMFVARRIDPALSPRNVIRECRDSEEHPCTIPVILGLDVTGSMGSAAMEVAKKLNVVMTSLYEKVKDVEFMIMGIGDLAYDNAPIQASQFESDIRIAEQLDKIYFEGGGGGNGYESYTAAWYFGLEHTKLDCWNRGKKGIIITMGDEPLNPYLPRRPLNAVTGDRNQGDVPTKDLYKEVIDKFEIFHLSVNDKNTCYRHINDGHSYTGGTNCVDDSFKKYLGENYRVVNLDNIADEIIKIVVGCVGKTEQVDYVRENLGMISW